MRGARPCVMAGLLAGALAACATAQVCAIKVVTDASPDCGDIESLIHSATSRWETPAEKCWALWYWLHIGRRQTSPMMLHGTELTDPIRQLNDYGYAMCSTVAGMNCALWDAMGYGVRFWDVTLHTVSEVDYGGRWHMYDNSMSALYTLCDGVTIAGVEGIGKAGACAASGGREEPGHIARYHCLNATSANGFLTGADCARDLAQEHRCFNPAGLKLRYYYRNWDRGHTFALNLRAGEAYTRSYASLGDTPGFYVPNEGKDPEAANPRYRIRGNGVREFAPRLTAEMLARVAHALDGVEAAAPEGVRPADAGKRGTVIFKLEGANVICSLRIRAACRTAAPEDGVAIAISTTNGIVWKDVWTSEGAGAATLDLGLVAEVNGSYETLVRVTLAGMSGEDGARLDRIAFEWITMVNSKMLPRLLLGRNTVHVGFGEQTESIVLWPDLRRASYKESLAAEENIAAEAEHPGYQGVLHAREGRRAAYVVYRIESPRDIVKVVYGGRLYNRAPGAHIDFLHSFDGGATWARSYTLARTEPPWDVIRYEAVDDVPAGTRAVLFKYLIESDRAGSDAASIYALRMEAMHAPADPTLEPLQVTLAWREVGPDRSLVDRSHTANVTKMPCRYDINVGGADHPVMTSLRVARGDRVETGYSDGKDAGGEKFVPRWVTHGKNLAEGRPYTVTAPSRDNWGAGDPDETRLTDGIVGPPYAGGASPAYAACWAEGDDPVITVDLGAAAECAAFRVQVSAGWPWWDALKGEVKDRIELLTSVDGHAYEPRGAFATGLWWKDIPVNHMMPDDETATGPVFELIPPAAVRARYVRFAIVPARILTVSEVQVLDAFRSEPFDLRISLPPLR